MFLNQVVIIVNRGCTVIITRVSGEPLLLLDRYILDQSQKAFVYDLMNVFLLWEDFWLIAVQVD